MNGISGYFINIKLCSADSKFNKGKEEMRFN
jgi:hypothetical protein